METKKNIEKIIENQYAYSLNHKYNGILVSIRYHEDYCRKLLNDIKELKELKPSKWHKKLYKLWQNTLVKTNTQYNEAFDKLLNEYVELENTISIYKN